MSHAQTVNVDGAAELMMVHRQTVLDLIAEPDAMIGITLVAPCQADARVVLSHGGLTVTARATATGSVFTSLPAMDAEGAVVLDTRHLLAFGGSHVPGALNIGAAGP